MNKIQVELKERSYDIIIERNSTKHLAEFLTQKSYSKIFIITDENIAKLHLAKLQSSLPKSEVIEIPAGEKTKSFSFLEKICEEILAKGVDRKSLIIAFGGGVVGDLSGFIASILLRGIDFIQIPTTLLAAVDSSVGGKTAINSKAGKNLIGSFYQPKLVLCNLEFLKTLPKRELRSGYAEVVKYGLIRDRNFFDFLDENHAKLFSHDVDFLEKIITRSCELKAEIVGRDELESGERMLLNFGHTFGHVFETETKYSDEILHGEAVAMGMAMAAKMSCNLGFIKKEISDQICSHLEKCGFTTDPKKIRKDWNEENLISHLAKDKKNENKNLTFILLKKIGEAFVQKGVELQEFKKILNN
ncbi:MAG: 3-dehydroquinate synthase [Proteobacteria bacterium]|nr:3-dehydroquinate synthase [Pseudomonadota bacterium]